MCQVKDLKNQTGVKGPHSVLHCNECNNDHSANKSDYFAFSEDHILTCCDMPLEHVRKIVTVVYVPV